MKRYYLIEFKQKSAPRKKVTEIYDDLEKALLRVINLTANESIIFNSISLETSEINF